MKITIDLDDELKDAIELHLTTGYKVQDYIRTALAYFTAMRQIEAEGNNKCGYGDKSRFTQYNKELSPAMALNSHKTV